MRAYGAEAADSISVFDLIPYLGFVLASCPSVRIPEGFRTSGAFKATLTEPSL